MPLHPSTVKSVDVTVVYHFNPRSFHDTPTAKYSNEFAGTVTLSTGCYISPCWFGVIMRPIRLPLDNIIQ
mgnify:CR=1 FL=1